MTTASADPAGVIVREGGRAVVALGIATMILGIWAIAIPVFSGVATTAFLALLLVGVGLTRMIFAFKAPSWSRGIWTFLLGSLAIVCGGFLFARPLLGLASLTILMAVYFLVDGIVEIAAGFRIRPVNGWGWFVFGGLVSIVLAVLIWQDWPASTLWAIGVLLGVKLFFVGSSMIAVGFAGETFLDEAERKPETVEDTEPDSGVDAPSSIPE